MVSNETRGVFREKGSNRGPGYRVRDSKINGGPRGPQLGAAVGLEAVGLEDPLPGFRDTLETMLEIAIAKNADYAGEKGAFHNFETVENLGITGTAQGILVRMTDKLCRIANLVEAEARVKDESIEDTLIDLANYSIILKCYLASKKGGN